MRLKEFADINMGQSPNGDTYNTVGNGMPFLQGKKTFGTLYPIIDTWTTNPKKTAVIDDILMSVRAPVGDMNFANKEICIGRGLCSIKAKNGRNKYLYYMLLNSINDIKQKSTGTVFDSINRNDLGNLDFNFHSDDEQIKIETILWNIDSKIELNNKINKNLFEWLKEYFKDKFYNNKEKNSYLIDYISETIGGDWGKENQDGNNNTRVYCVRGADIPSMEYGNKGNAPVRYILEKNYNKKKLKPNNIIIEISGGSPIQSTGRIAYITEHILNIYDSPLLCTNFCRAIETKNNILAPFVYMNLKLMYEDDLFFNWENGTTGIKNLALNDMLSNLEVGVPNEKELNEYYLLFHIIMNKISNNSNENMKLSQLRDTLLPRLMNGEIDLSNVEI
ncbi:MAG: restriction endonuclease subunit S [Bacteroidetes bacterium]|nr:restriction endonuclease subunit S [Bacteroidota bacterium]